MKKLGINATMKLIESADHFFHVLARLGRNEAAAIAQQVPLPGILVSFGGRASMRSRRRYRDHHKTGALLAQPILASMRSRRRCRDHPKQSLFVKASLYGLQ